MVKNREVYFLKIFALSIAFACTSLILVFSLNEFGYDRFHRNANSMFRLLQRSKKETVSGNRLSVRIPQTVFAFLAHQDSLRVARVKTLKGMFVAAGSTKVGQVVHAVDPSFLSLFSLTLVDGSFKEFEKGENCVLLSASAATQYLQTTHATGKKIKILSLDDSVDFTVVGVFQDLPNNSHEGLSVLIPFQPLLVQALNFSPDEVGVYGKFEKHGENTLGEFTQLKFTDPDFTYHIQPLPDIYFGPRAVGEEARHGDRYSIIILIGITGLILFLALSTFVNLTTLSLPKRSKELAVRKLAGSGLFSLSLMFVAESFTIAAASLGIGFVMLFSTRQFTDPILSMDTADLILSGNVTLYLILGGLVAFTTLVPLFLTFKFTSATPTRLLSTETITFPRFKRIIAIFQLGISLFLLVGSMIVKRQINYSLIKEPGRNYYQVVYLRYPPGLTSEELANLRLNWKKYNPNIVDVIPTAQLPNQVNSKEIDSDFYTVAADGEFLAFFGLKILEGRWFRANDAGAVVVNESGRKKLKGHENTIGVIENLNGQFNQPERPIKIWMTPYYQHNFLCIRILEVDIRKTMQNLSHQFGKDEPIRFLDKKFESWLVYQDRLDALSDALTIISGLLACCAIYGLSLSIVRDKIKQIAIHKLYGASILNITRILALDFAPQMTTVLLVFTPLTYIFLKEWLRNFVYATAFTWTDPLIPLAFCTSIIIALCAFQALTLNRSDLTASLKQ